MGIQDSRLEEYFDSDSTKYKTKGWEIISYRRVRNLSYVSIRIFVILHNGVNAFGYYKGQWLVQQLNGDNYILILLFCDEGILEEELGTTIDTGHSFT